MISDFIIKHFRQAKARYHAADSNGNALEKSHFKRKLLAQCFPFEYLCGKCQVRCTLKVTSPWKIVAVMFKRMRASRFAFINLLEIIVKGSKMQKAFSSLWYRVAMEDDPWSETFPTSISLLSLAQHVDATDDGAKRLLRSSETFRPPDPNWLSCLDLKALKAAPSNGS